MKKESCLGIYQRLVSDILCGGSASHSEYVFNWLSLLIQTPMEPPGTALVFRGPKATGKSTLGNAICSALPASSYRTETLAVLQLPRMPFEDKAFLLIDGAGSIPCTDKIVSLIAEGGESTSLSVMINLLCGETVPPNSCGGRRFAVIDVPPVVQPDPSFWQSFYVGRTGRFQLEPLIEFVKWLGDRDIGDFEPVLDLPLTIS